MIDGWHHGDYGIYDNANAGGGEDDVCKRVVDVEEGNNETGQEQENRDMKEGRDGLHNDGCMEASHTFGEEGADAGTFVNRDLRLGKKEISASPALLECCKQSAEEGYDEAQKPKHIYQDGRCWWSRV